MIRLLIDITKAAVLEEYPHRRLYQSQGRMMLIGIFIVLGFMLVLNVLAAFGG